MAMTDVGADPCMIRLMPSGRESLCRPGQTLLDAAIRSGMTVPYGCRHGTCASCKAKVLEGDYELMPRVSEFALMSFERDEGYILMCSTLPQGDMVVEVDEEDVEPGIEIFPITDFRAEIVSNVAVTPDIHVLRLKLKQPGDVVYTAGQYFEFNIPGLPETRAYSMATTYSCGNTMEFHVKRVPQGVGSNFLCDLVKGASVTGSGPYGRMQLGSRERNLIFVAGGSGLAPIKALVEKVFSEDFRKEAWLFYGARTGKDLYLVPEWVHMAEKYPNFHFIPALSNKDDEKPWNGEEGYIADVVSRKMAGIENAHAFLCGPPIMIETTLKSLYKLGLYSSDISYDEF